MSSVGTHNKPREYPVLIANTHLLATGHLDDPETKSKNEDVLSTPSSVISCVLRGTVSVTPSWAAITSLEFMGRAASDDVQGRDKVAILSSMTHTTPSPSFDASVNTILVGSAFGSKTATGYVATTRFKSTSPSVSAGDRLRRDSHFGSLALAPCKKEATRPRRRKTR